jgi:signal transduction histidine kinase
LLHAYLYVGAHTNPMRFEHERDRALQRTLISLAAVIWIIAYNRLESEALTPIEAEWLVGAVLYAVASLAFWSYLGKHRDGGVHIQYAFFALDPLIVGCALYASPRAVDWWLVLMLVLVLRVGFRYGLNAMKAELVFAGLGASIPMGFSDYLQTEVRISWTLAGMLVACYWLFAPLSRILEKARLLEVEQARMQSLQQSLKAKGEFLSQVSHELKSRLQSVVSSLDVIEERSSPTEAEMLARIRRGTDALHAQIRDLLTLARGEAGKMEVNPIPFEAGELMRSVACDVQPEAEANGLQMLVEVPAEPIFVVADPARIDQVVTNLLTNAIRHSRRGKVQLRLHPFEAERQSLRFEVSDSGDGIPDARIPSLFEPYTRFGDIHAAGTGLGLAIVRSVLHHLDGTISVKSILGIGTTFSVEIPAEPADSDGDPSQTTRGRVLVVTRYPEVLEEIVAAVRQLGLECDTASSVGKAANLLGARRYGSVLLDMDLPVKSGRDVAIDVRRADGPNQASTIVLLSDIDVPPGQPGWPFDGHLTKPITQQAVRRIIGPQARRERVLR